MPVQLLQPLADCAAELPAGAAAAAGAAAGSVTAPVGPRLQPGATSTVITQTASCIHTAIAAVLTHGTIQKGWKQ